MECNVDWKRFSGEIDSNLKSLVQPVFYGGQQSGPGFVSFENPHHVYFRMSLEVSIIIIMAVLILTDIIIVIFLIGRIISSYIWPWRRSSPGVYPLQDGWRTCTTLIGEAMIQLDCNTIRRSQKFSNWFQNKWEMIKVGLVRINNCRSAWSATTISISISISWTKKFE